MNSKPCNYGNANCILETCKPIIKIPLLMYEEIFDFYSQEPLRILAAIDSESEKFWFHKVCRIRRWISSDRAYSWCIYKEEPELTSNTNHNLMAGNLIVRYVEWDVRLDQKLIKETPSANREDLLNNWPSIQTTNVFLNSKWSEKLRKQLLGFDQLIKDGFLLKPKLNPSWDWRDLEVWRLYDWGSIHNTWSPVRTNEQVEMHIIKVEELLKQCIDGQDGKIYSMELDYSVEPTVCKNAICGV